MTTNVPENTSSAAASAAQKSCNTYSQTVYTNPVTGISFTRQQLYEYGQGQKTNEKGDVVFFRAGFVDEDPWKALRDRK
jgi:hypothetical protein